MKRPGRSSPQPGTAPAAPCGGGDGSASPYPCVTAAPCGRQGAGTVLSGGPAGLLLGEVADHRQLEVPALEGLDHSKDPGKEEDDPEQPEQQADEPARDPAERRGEERHHRERHRLHGVEADLRALVDQEEDQPRDQAEHVRQAGGDVLAQAACRRRLVAGGLWLVAGRRRLVALLRLVAGRLAPLRAAGGGRRRWRRLPAGLLPRVTWCGSLGHVVLLSASARPVGRALYPPEPVELERPARGEQHCYRPVGLSAA